MPNVYFCFSSKPDYMRHLLVVTLCFLLTHQAFAQSRKTFHLPAARTEKEIQLGVERARLQRDMRKAGGGLEMPANMRMPGEFEESQAVSISWAYDYAGTQDSPYVSGNDVTSSYGWVSAQLAHYISQECLVIIRAWSAQDTIAIKNFMATQGIPLTQNYMFHIEKGDDWWTRDFGPMAFYHGSQDSIAFTDMKYYDGRDLDNDYPISLGKLMGYKVYTTTLNAEGGNLMADGFGTMVFSNRIQVNNSANFAHNPPWPYSTTFDTMRNVLGTPVLVDTLALQCDGGTGHIDLYMKFIDEQTIIIAKYPDTIKAVDKLTIEKSYQQLLSVKSPYNKPYRIYRIPHPTDDNGRHTRLTCAQINADARNFINGLTVNKTFLFPAYSDDVNGNQAQTQEVVKLYQSIMPGYKVIPIDSRDLSPLGGAIHCITMQIPAENPVLFWHPAIDGLQPRQTDNFYILAKITNKSGISSAKCMWRIKGSGWNTLNLTDSAGYFRGIINAPGLQHSQKIDYYITATTNNGKTAVKPITAPDGFYTIAFEYGSGKNELLSRNDYRLTLYPNPAGNSVTLGILTEGKATAHIRMMNMLGKTVYERSLQTLTDLTEEVVDLSGFANGVYVCELMIDGKPVQNRKFVVNR